MTMVHTGSKLMFKDFQISVITFFFLVCVCVYDCDYGALLNSAFYSVSRPGKYKLHVKLNDVHHIAGSPFDVEVLQLFYRSISANVS